jgi:hypothetical protein
MPSACKLDREIRSGKVKGLKGNIMAQLKPLIENLLVKERDRQIEQFGKRGTKVIRWGYTVRRYWQTPWGVLRRVRMPRLRGVREIGLMEKYHPQIAARLVRADQWQKKCLEYWAAWVFLLAAGCPLPTAPQMRP